MASKTHQLALIKEGDVSYYEVRVTKDGHVGPIAQPRADTTEQLYEKVLDMLKAVTGTSPITINRLVKRSDG